MQLKIKTNHLRVFMDRFVEQVLVDSRVGADGHGGKVDVGN